jgi:hypothetical protein
MFRRFSFRYVALPVGLTVLVAGCSGLSTRTETMEDQWKKDHPSGSIFGNEGGLDLFNTKRSRASAQDGSGIGVNDLLWRASLDTLSFLPLPTPPDPFGGVIVYDWYSAPETPNERFKVNVFILDRQLRADGIRVSVFKQVRDGAGWRDAGQDGETATKLEDAILTRARQIRSAQTDVAK